MRFKRGDIVECMINNDRVVFRLSSDARQDYYIQPWGTYSKDKSWWASGKHLEGPYKGTYVHTFHLDGCVLNNTFGLTKEIKKLEL